MRKPYVSSVNGKFDKNDKKSNHHERESVKKGNK
jgi:hypothetical protein